jgi:hypothetical protein
MNLHRLLQKKKSAIRKRWLDEIFTSYPPDACHFLKDEMDVFANPVGHTISANADYILEGLIKGDDTSSLSPYLEWIIRIRAVQDFTPTQVVSFVGSLKSATIGLLQTDIQKHNLWEEWEELSARIDTLTLMSFEIYTKMKEKIHSIQMKELEKSEKFLIRLMESRTR